jgi:hypothetical protein
LTEDYRSDHTGSSGTYRDAIAHIRLYGNDGSFWNLSDGFAELTGTWVSSNIDFSVNHRDLRYTWNITQENETNWQSLSIESLPMPVGGQIRVFLVQSSLYGTVNDTHFANLQLDMIPMINGIYQKLTGQYHKVSTADNLRANVEEEVFMSDSPNPNYKGTLFRYNGLSYVPTSRWYNYLAGTTGELGLDKFGKYQAFALWNQNRRIIRKFEGSLKGLDSITPLDMPGMIHRYRFTASDTHSDNKYFMLLSFDQDLLACTWDGVFEDVYDTVEGKIYTDTYEFKYTMK